MTIGGWVIMALSVGGVTSLLAWCINRILRQPETTRKLHSQADINTHDTQ